MPDTTCRVCTVNSRVSEFVILFVILFVHQLSGGPKDGKGGRPKELPGGPKELSGGTKDGKGGGPKELSGGPKDGPKELSGWPNEGSPFVETIPQKI